MLGLMPLGRLDTRSLSLPQRGLIRTNVVVGLAGVSHCLQGTRLRHPSIISPPWPVLSFTTMAAPMSSTVQSGGKR